jgi:Tfp pilus assembly protein PilV
MRTILPNLPVKSLNQSGDTIVEVLICIAVVASILAGAFVVSNRSSTAVRTSEEHAQALQYLQGQIEQLRADAQIKPFSAFGANTKFCYKSDGTFTTYSAANCTQATLYTLQIQAPPSAPPAGGTATFKASVSWDALGGGTNHEDLFYKVQTNG